MRFRSLTTKIVLSIFLSVSLIFSGIFIYNYTYTTAIVEKNIRENSINLALRSVQEIDKVFFAVQKITNNNSDIFKKENYSETEIYDILRIMLEGNKEIYAAALAFPEYKYSPDKKYYAPYICKLGDSLNYMNIGADNYNYYQMEWFSSPFQSGKACWSEPYFDKGAGNTMMITYSVPIYKTINGKRELYAVLTADVSLDWLDKFMGNIKIYNSGYAFIISKSSRFVTHPKKELLIKETAISLAERMPRFNFLKAISQKMIAGDTGLIEENFVNYSNQKDSWLAYAPIIANGWAAGFVYPIDEFMSDVTALNNRLLLLSIIALVSLLAVIILVSKSIAKPIKLLTKATEKISTGDYFVKLPKIDSQDEVAKLNNSFDSMIQTLNSTINDLKHTSEALAESNSNLELANRTLEDKVEQRTAELKNINTELNLANSNMITLSEIGKSLTSSLDFEVILAEIYTQINKLMQSHSFAIMTYNELNNTLEGKFAIENNQRLPYFEFQLTDTNRYAVWCFANNAEIFINDNETEYQKYLPNRSAPKAGVSMSSIIYLPLVTDGKLIGVISVQSFNKNAFSERHLDILRNLAVYTAIALSNAMAYQAINKANTELKEAQDQLIQAEKMASLGQLTAGIAHEIKNPLNFVNNFSELSIDIVEELKEEIDNIEIETQIKENIEDLLSDLSINSKKINEHGKRADSIVKGMLLHSRGKSGEMQKTNINDLLAEYVNLAYHGMRASDNSFNIKIEQNFAADLPQLYVVPQDLSRVFLNLINNACYSTHEKKQELQSQYNPILNVSTSLDSTNNQAIIRIRDNGKGISQENINKIFNPFFTTKPTGKGTGLGLSLSYEIITKTHQGEIAVESELSEYAEFIIKLPINARG